MKLGKCLFIGLAMVALMACESETKSESRTAGSGPIKGGAGKNEQTTPSLPPSPGDRTSSGDIIGRWYVDFQGQDITMRMAFAFSQNKLILMNTCNYGHGLHPVSVSVQVPIAIYPDRFEVLSDGQNEVVEDQNGQDTRCDVSIRTSTNYYTVQGSQMRLSQPGYSEEMVLTRY